ncbi:MAG: phosphotransferase, partial [Pseudomonadota bacterium]
PRILAALPNLPKQALHGDLNLENILVAKDQNNPIGIIDFGEMYWGARICDLAILCSFAFGQKAEPFAHIEALVAAFHQQRPLTAVEIDVLPEFIALRCMTVLLTGEYLASKEPDNRDYFLKSAPRSLAALNVIMSHRDALASALKRISLGA